MRFITSWCLIKNLIINKIDYFLAKYRTSQNYFNLKSIWASILSSIQSINEDLDFSVWAKKMKQSWKGIGGQRNRKFEQERFNTRNTNLPNHGNHDRCYFESNKWGQGHLMKIVVLPGTSHRLAYMRLK